MRLSYRLIKCVGFRMVKTLQILNEPKVLELLWKVPKRYLFHFLYYFFLYKIRFRIRQTSDIRIILNSAT